MYFVYIIRCKDGSLYTGITTDVERRFIEHREGRGASYTRSRGVIEVVYWEKVRDRSSALRRETGIKKLTRAEKLSLVGQG